MSMWFLVVMPFAFIMMLGMGLHTLTLLCALSDALYPQSGLVFYLLSFVSVFLIFSGSSRRRRSMIAPRLVRLARMSFLNAWVLAILILVMPQLQARLVCARFHHALMMTRLYVGEGISIPAVPFITKKRFRGDFFKQRVTGGHQ